MFCIFKIAIVLAVDMFDLFKHNCTINNAVDDKIPPWPLLHREKITQNTINLLSLDEHVSD